MLGRLLVLALAIAQIPYLALAQGKEASQEEIPELAGAIRAEGSQLIDGKLPRPYVDYSIDLLGVSRRLSLFQNGLVVVTTVHGGESYSKKILIPPGAVDAYRPHLSSETLERLYRDMIQETPSDDRETIRIWNDDGKWTERSFDPSMRLPFELEEMLGIVRDLMRVIVDDRDITNSMADYEPREGDELISEDFTVWLVIRVDHSAQIVEVHDVGNPIRMFLAWKDLETRFVAHRRGAPDPE